MRDWRKNWPATTSEFSFDLAAETLRQITSVPVRTIGKKKGRMENTKLYTNLKILNQITTPHTLSRCTSMFNSTHSMESRILEVDPIPCLTGRAVPCGTTQSQNKPRYTPLYCTMRASYNRE